MDLWLRIYAIAMLVLGIYAFLTTVLNIRYFRSFDKTHKPEGNPLISVVVPARNEENNIERLIKSLQKQSYRNIEILVINDQSTDRTQEILDTLSKEDERIRVYSVNPDKKLNENGKINALLQLIPHAKGEFILATDADTMHSENCIEHAYAVMENHKLDIISGYPTELCSSFFGNICMSAMMLTCILIPQFIIHRFPIPAASFAIGQFIMMRKSAYEETGGYSAIEGAICDDVGIVRLFVKHKKKYAFLNLSKYSACFMYRNMKESFIGIERSVAGIIPMNAFSVIPLLIAIILLLHIALSPIAAAAFLIYTGFALDALLLAAGAAIFVLAWFIGCKAENWRKRISISCSLTMLMTAAMLIHAFYKEVTGKGFEWKGRKVI